VRGSFIHEDAIDIYGVYIWFGKGLSVQALGFLLVEEVEGACPRFEAEGSRQQGMRIPWELCCGGKIEPCGVPSNTRLVAPKPSSLRNGRWWFGAEVKRHVHAQIGACSMQHQ